ncbi:uncharacterized protein LOC143236945 isoform X2 [Tachypleus tridentatus]|uniref:uncharacterized protein LOC143236945 isoform X2 n=1 Tax=Tachypleus tridentatus TaxID=6853 RepID=UPI003FD5F464
MVADHSAFEYEGEYDIEKDIPRQKEQYPTPDCRTPKYRTIFDVVRTGTLEAVEFLVERYGLGILTERDDLGHTPAHWACIGGHADILEYMVEHGVPVDSASLSKVAAHPIHWACVHGYISVVDILIEAGVHVDVLDARQCTPLMTASRHGHTNLVGYLIGRGANPRTTNINGNGPIHWAAYKGYPEMMRLLIYSGADPEHRDILGQTPLHLASANGNLIAVRDLCEKDRVEIDPLDDHKRKPLDIAQARRHTAVVKYLERELQKRQSLLPRIDIWQIVFGPAGNSKGPLLFFLCSVFLWGYPMYLFRCVPLTWDDHPNIHTFFLTTNAAMWASLIAAHSLDPGYLPRNTKEYHQTIRQITNLKKWRQDRSPVFRLCHTCRTVRPLRAKHCRVCNRCILHFDHHCPYIYNCVGLYNRIWFLLFSAMVAVNCSVTVYFAFACIWKEGWTLLYVAGLLEAVFFCVLGWVLAGSTSCCGTDEHALTRRRTAYW